MSELLPFGSVKRCTKCLSIYLSRKYVSSMCQVLTVPERFEYTPEHLLVTCEECGCSWREQCADAGPQVKEGG
jgi:hypothetical protein